MPQAKIDIITRLRKEVLLLQGFKTPAAGTTDMGLGPIASSFPNGSFPTGTIHEFLTTSQEAAAATNGFAAGLLGKLMQGDGVALWIGSKRKLFPPGLKSFGVDPDRVIFIDLKNEKQVLWAMEEALKCEGLAAVGGETSEIGFTASRRLQLAVEQSRVTGFILRHTPRNLNTIASVARWRISPLQSKPEDGMPGLGFPRWNVELEKIRNGRPGSWEMEWSAGRFHPLTARIPALPQQDPSQHDQHQQHLHEHLQAQHQRQYQQRRRTG
jgi:protein ImuA